MKKIFVIYLLFIICGYVNAQTYTSEHTGSEIDSSISGYFGSKNISTSGNFLGQKLIGGTGTTSDLYLQTTSGVGTTGADMHFLVGNNGGTEAITILNDGKVGIGGITPESKLHVGTEGAENFFISDTWYTNANGGGFTVGHSRGTQLSPVGLSANDAAGSFYFRGMRSNGTWTNLAQIKVVAEQTITTSAYGSYLSIELGNTSTGTRPERLRITGAGFLGVGTTVPNKQVEINSSTGNNLRLTYNDNNGSAANYSDFNVSSSGDLTIGASGGQVILPMESDSTQCTTGQLWFNSTTGAIHRKF